MSVVKFAVGMTLWVDPEAVRDYSFDLTDWLEGDAISAVVVEAKNCTANETTATNTEITVRVSQVRVNASVCLKVTLASGQSDDFTVYFRPFER